MLTGGRGELTWEQAAERFVRGDRAVPAHAQQAGVTLAIENASALYADIHIAHTLRDTIALAEMADLGICIDLFHCWAEADLTPCSAARCRGPVDPAQRLCARRPGASGPRRPRRRRDPDRGLRRTALAWATRTDSTSN